MDDRLPQTFDLQTCRDMLEKLRRERDRYTVAKRRPDLADCAFNFMVTAVHLSAWVARDAAIQAERPEDIDTPPNHSAGLPHTEEEVRDLVEARCPELGKCRTFVNASKHAKRKPQFVWASASGEWNPPPNGTRSFAEAAIVSPDDVTWQFYVKDELGKLPAAEFFDRILRFWHEFIYGHFSGR